MKIYEDKDADAENQLMMNDDIQKPTREEVANTIQRMNNHRALGTDMIPAEVFRHGVQKLLTRCIS